MTVAELITILQKLDPQAVVVAPFSPNPSEINVEEVGGAFKRKDTPYPNGIELTRVHDRRTEFKPPSNAVRVSKENLETIRDAGTDAPV
jgi:hypothetical protein